jgi:hypothetical protein
MFPTNRLFIFFLRHHFEAPRLWPGRCGGKRLHNAGLELAEAVHGGPQEGPFREFRHPDFEGLPLDNITKLGKRRHAGWNGTSVENRVVKKLDSFERVKLVGVVEADFESFKEACLSQ